MAWPVFSWSAPSFGEGETKKKPIILRSPPKEKTMPAYVSAGLCKLSPRMSVLVHGHLLLVISRHEAQAPLETWPWESLAGVAWTCIMGPLDTNAFLAGAAVLQSQRCHTRVDQSSGREHPTLHWQLPTAIPSMGPVILRGSKAGACCS